MIFDVYGNEQVYLVQPSKVDYVIPNYGQVDAVFNEAIFRTYKLADNRGVCGGLSIQLNQDQAVVFTKVNSLQQITEEEQRKLVEA